MMKDLKLGFRFLNFAYGKKALIACAVGLFVLGVPMCVVGMLMATNPWGSYFLILGICLPSQSIVSLLASNWVLASPVRRRLEISAFTMMQFVVSAVIYLLVLVIGGIVAISSPEQIGHVCSQLIWTSACMALILVYVAASRKYFISSTIGFIILFFFLEAFLDMAERMLPPKDGWGLFAGAALQGMVIILCGSGLMYLLNLALYKAPMSKLCQSAGLRRTL